MTLLKVSSFIKIIDSYLMNETSFEDLRRFVYQYYENEKSYKIDKYLEQLFLTLSPYLEYEEANRDSSRRSKMHRLRAILKFRNSLIERSIFSLEFSTIMDLTNKYRNKIIQRNIYEDQIRKLSPVTFDIRKIILWASAHLEEDNLNTNKM